LPIEQMPPTAVVIGREAGDGKLLEIVLTRRAVALDMPKLVQAYGEQQALVAQSFMLSMDFGVAKDMLEEKISPVTIKVNDSEVKFDFTLGVNAFLSHAELLASH